MTYNILGSGSSGNATIVFDHILIDCGLPYSKIAAYAKEIQLVLLTHEHGDHFKASTVKKLHDERPTVRFACCEWMATHLMNAGVDSRHIDVLDPDKQYVYGMIAVTPFRVQHNVPNCGWKIFHKYMTSARWYCDEKLFYVTDACNLDGIEAVGYDLYMIECNHHEEEIQARIEEKQKTGQFSYEVAAAQNHLSWEQALSWLAENGPNSKFIPMHQHVDKE